MKRVLVVASGRNGALSPIIKNQIDSLAHSSKARFDVFLILGGFSGYLSSIVKLVGLINTKNHDLIHAHYSLSGFVAAIASLGRVPVVCSLMGSDVMKAGVFRNVTKFFVKRIWKATIVKSVEMKTFVGNKNVFVIPNGVDLDKFQPLDPMKCREVLGWNADQIIVLFPANPNRPEKNYSLALKAFQKLNFENKVLKVLEGVSHDLMPLWLNASDVILLTSHYEGSPNVIKEALACNRPIVSTDVGDVRERLENVQGCYVSEADPTVLSNLIIEALSFSKVDGRRAILNLDESIVASSVLNVYMNSI